MDVTPFTGLGIRLRTVYPGLRSRCSLQPRLSNFGLSAPRKAFPGLVLDLERLSMTNSAHHNRSRLRGDDSPDGPDPGDNAAEALAAA